MKLGYNRQITLSAATGTIVPSDGCAALFAQIAIILPSAGTIAVSLWMAESDNVDMQAKIVLSVILGTTLLMTLEHYYIAMFSDPGILPSVHMNTGINFHSKRKADPLRSYYVEYMTK